MSLDKSTPERGPSALAETAAGVKELGRLGAFMGRSMAKAAYPKLIVAGRVAARWAACSAAAFAVLGSPGLGLFDDEFVEVPAATLSLAAEAAGALRWGDGQGVSLKKAFDSPDLEGGFILELPTPQNGAASAPVSPEALEGMRGILNARLYHARRFLPDPLARLDSARMDAKLAALEASLIPVKAAEAAMAALSAASESGPRRALSARSAAAALIASTPGFGWAGAMDPWAVRSARVDPAFKAQARVVAAKALAVSMGPGALLALLLLASAKSAARKIRALGRSRLERSERFALASARPAPLAEPAGVIAAAPDETPKEGFELESVGALSASTPTEPESEDHRARRILERRDADPSAASV